MPEYVKKEKKTFRDRIFEHLDRILEITTKEFTGGYWIKKIQNNFTEETYVPDQRKCYIQSVESWADMLYPYFKESKTMPKDFEDIEKEIDKILKEFEEEKIDQDKYILLKTRLIKKLFRRLNLFLGESKIARIKLKKTIG